MEYLRIRTESETKLAEILKKFSNSIGVFKTQFDNEPQFKDQIVLFQQKYIDYIEEI